MDKYHPDIVPDAFRFLIKDFGFRVVRAEASPDSYNMFVDLANNAMIIRLSRDGDLFGAAVRSPGFEDRCLPLSSLRGVVLNRDPAEEVTFAAQAEFVKSHLATIAELVSAPHFADTYARVIQFRRDRLNKLYPGSVRDA